MFRIVNKSVIQTTQRYLERVFFPAVLKIFFAPKTVRVHYIGLVKQ